MQFERIRNFRDIGGPETATGGHVRTGHVFRSAHLADATDRDLATLSQLGVGTVVDLRDPHDIDEHGENRLPAGARLLRVPYQGQRDTSLYDLLNSGDAPAIMSAFPAGAAYQAMVAVATTAVSDACRLAQFADTVRHVAKTDKPIVIQCAAGKDRTGFAVAIIYLILGVADDVIIADYLRSNVEPIPRMGETLARLVTIGVDPTLIAPLMAAQEDYIRAFLNAIDDEWGGVTTYISDGLGIRAEEIAALRRRLII